MAQRDDLKLLKEVIGLELDDERLLEVLEAYRAIGQEIARLRTLDLTEVHPAVAFDPVIAPVGKTAR